MNNYNPNIHHRKSIRLKGYDYSRAGLYFITICVHNRECLFGEIVAVDDLGVQNFEPLKSSIESVSSIGVENFEPLQQHRYQMILNNAGNIADVCWLEIPKHFPNAVLHEHIVMPNHVHGIIELKRIDTVPKIIADNTDIPVGTSHVMSLLHNHDQIRNHNQFSKPIPHSISVIIQQYKSSVTRFVNKINNSNFKWQSRFYEHIIRNEQSYQRIADYIINNPNNWQEYDVFNK